MYDPGPAWFNSAQPGSQVSLARIFTTTPRAGELFFLRLLLMRVPGPTSFLDLRTVDGEVLPTMQQACSARGLLEDGEHWDRALAEATTSGYPNRLRLLFAIILTEGGATCDPVRLWAAHQPAMSEDITHRQELLRAAGRPCMSAEEIQHETLRRVGLCLQRLCGRTVGSFGLPEPPAAPVGAEAEPDFALDQQQAYLAENEHLLTADQRVVYDEVVRRLTDGTGGASFLQAPGGCGKTFLENVLLAKVRSQGEVAVAVATSGIAACLLDGGTTAHYRFKIPLRLHADENVCGMAQRTPEAELLQACRLIVWDEAAMANRRALEAVDRTLRNLRDTDEEFGGIVTVLSGDWRQILPVVRNGCRAQVVDACLKSSPLWNTVTVMQLETNMRVQLHQDARAAEFSDFLLRVGNGELPIVRELGEDVIDVPLEIRSPATSVAELAVRIFPDLAANYVDTEWLHQRAILTPRNSDVDKVNQVLMEMLPGATAEYRSIDSMTDPEAVPMPTEVLNSLELSGLPSHHLTLKVGAPVILMRNIDAPRTVNGTLCTVSRLHANVLELRVGSGPSRGEALFLPRLPLEVDGADSGLGFSFRNCCAPSGCRCGRLPSPSWPARWQWC
ncbi:ATP-dependent DNA helicase pif1-like [Amphibalanus amphitrite]|uniref:ATP-dependent DNA helicase pif1-like n=1 Tax=Amphibalanus amphitrite TaxID=1232801 RepID=UPI001C9133DF|nr:ATP-dependent DNA helicase pif1-like [Amphibalanus amphitrite]